MSRTTAPDQPRTPRPRSARDLFFGGATTDSRAADVGLLLLRLIAGLSLAFAHGIGKVPPSPGFLANVTRMGFPAPELFAWLAAMAEFGGGLLLAAGLLTRFAGLYVAGHFAIILMVAQAGEPFTEREKPLLFGAIALLYLFVGAGRYSLDALIRRRGR